MKSPLRGLEMPQPPHYQHHIYDLILGERPGIVVETGLESGWGAEHILKGLDDNDRGHLWSIDPSVQPAFKENPIVHPRFTWIEKRSQDALELLFREIGPFDLFIHDSDHSFECQSWEYERALEYVRPGGIIATDDPFVMDSHGEWHHAWFKFLERHGYKGKQTIIGNAHWIRK